MVRSCKKLEGCGVMSLLVLLFVWMQLASGQVPMITTPPMDTVVSRGDPFNLTCIAEGNPAPTISWERDGVLVGNGLVVEDNLVFDGALPDHAGIYACVARSGEKVARAYATVTVNYSPVFLSLHVMPSDEVVNGTTVSLNCAMDGHPTPNVSWFHNGQEVMEGPRVMSSPEGVLLLLSVQLCDAGVYSCNGTNSLGTAESDISIMLRVYYPPMNIMVHGSPSNFRPLLGGPVRLTCFASSLPESTYTWLLEERDREVEVVEGSGLMMFDGNGTLQFDMAGREDSGKYFCTATNDYGCISSDSVMLEVQALPLAPGGVMLGTPTSSSVTVHWDSITNTYPPISMYYVEHRLDLQDRPWNEAQVGLFPTRLQLTDLLPHAQYLVRVRAYNQLGRGVPSDHISFETQLGVPQYYNTPLTPTVVVSGPRSLTVQWMVHSYIRGTSYAFTRIEVSSAVTMSHTLNVVPGSVEVTGLVPNTLYTVALRLSFEGGGLGPAVQRQTTTHEDAPDSAPEDLTVTSVTAEGVTLSWSPPSLSNGNITYYTITYQPLNGSEEAELRVVPGDTVDTMIVELCPFTNYTVSVFANTSEGAGPAESTVFTTLEAAPPPPSIVEEFAINSTALFLSWQLEGKVPGILASYNVSYRRVGESQLDYFIELGPDKMTVVVGGLGVWSLYEVCVRAATQGGGPGENNCTRLRTLGSEPTLQLDLVAVVPSCPPSLTVTWQPVTSNLSQLNGPLEEAVYTILLENVMSGVSESVNVTFNIATTSQLVSGLILGTQYKVTVAVSNSNGTGSPSKAITMSTPPSGAPSVTNPAVEAAPTFLLLSWDAPPPSPTFPSYNYTVTITSLDRKESTANTSLYFTGLTPATGYMLSLVTDGGCGFSQPVSVSSMTLEAPPGPPLVTIITVSASSMVVGWVEPEMPNGDITGYKVVCGDSAPAVVDGTESYYECNNLNANMPLSVMVWAVNGAGDGEMVTLNTSTACPGGVPMVETGGGEVRVVIDEGCPSEAHVLVVVQGVGSGQARPLGSYSVAELKQLTKEYTSRQQSRRQVSQATIYIAANVTRGTHFPFQLGDSAKYGGYTNYPLVADTEYIVGVVSVSADTTKPAVFAASRGFTSPSDETTDDPEFPVVVVAAVAGTVMVLLVAVFCVGLTTLICCRRKRRGEFPLDTQRKGSTHSFERSGSVRISGRRGNKLTDPVEEYRTNYHTEALEAHVPVPIDGFINKLLVMRTNDNQLFLEEFGSVEMAPQQPCSVAELPANRSKNRYHNILPYDHSRVKLSHGKGQSDYINASYCSGFMKVQGFIATQGPLPDTVPDFWRLVWEQNAHTVVMLTNAQERLKTKCEVYWPREVGCSIVHGSIEVTLTDFTQLADYTIRSLTLNKAGSGKEVREVRQFHFTSWPDHGVPQYATAMLAMVRRVHAFHTNEGGPMVVHCSAGVGRTGTFIVIYSMLERMKASRPSVDIYGHVSLLRTQRNYMVQTEDQYFFIYEAVAEVIVCGDTEVPLEQLEDYVNDILSVAHEHTDNTNIELQFKRLAVDKTDAYRFASANKDVNKAKNRYVNVLPYENRRVILQYQRAQEGSDYINASFVDGYHYRNAFIATQGPLQNTLADFWRMVWEHNVPVIVMLTKCQEKGTERSAQYWPHEVGHSLSCGLYSVEMSVERKSEHYTYRDLQLIDTQSGRKRQVRHFHYLSWPEVGVPASSLVLLDFLREVQKNFATLNTKSPVTVHCSNGIGRSGIFIALHILLERMVAEGLVDVFQTIKNLRIQRPAMVQTLEQYQFCYTAALDYLESSDLVNQLRSSTRSDTHSLRAASNASELRASRRSLNRNDSVRSSAKRSSRNLEMSQVGNGVSTTVYGGSEATSTFGTSQQLHPVVAPRSSLEDSPYPQGTLQGVTNLGDGSGTPVPPLHPSPLPPTASPSPGPRLLANPHLTHLEPSAGSQGSSTFLSAQSSVPQLQSTATSGSYHSFTGSQGSGHSSPPHPVLQTNTLPSRGAQLSQGTSGLLQSHWGMAGGSSSHSSLGRSAGSSSAYPVSSFGVRTGGQSTSQDNLERQLATLALNLNNSNNNNVVDVYIEP